MDTGAEGQMKLFRDLKFVALPSFCQTSRRIRGSVGEGGRITRKMCWRRANKYLFEAKRSFSVAHKAIIVFIIRLRVKNTRLFLLPSLETALI